MRAGGDVELAVAVNVGEADAEAAFLFRGGRAVVVGLDVGPLIEAELRFADFRDLGGGGEDKRAAENEGGGEKGGV